jgi:hypothetical protein
MFLQCVISYGFGRTCHCHRVETTTSIVVHRMSLSVGLQWLGWTQEHIKDTTVYPSSGYRGPTTSSLMILVFKSIQNWEGYNRVEERFGKGSFGVNPRLVSGEVSSSPERKKMMERGEELSALLLGWICSRCRARVVGREDGMICSVSAHPPPM